MARVSVIMPLYNAERYVEQAVRSILDQTYQDFELIVIDDCSSDGSYEKVSGIKDDRIRLLQNPRNMGIAETRNRGLREAVGEYLALLDDDDIALPHRLKEEVEYLDTHPDIMVVGGHQKEIDAQGGEIERKWIVYQNPAYVKAYLMFNNAVVNGSAMFRRSFIEEHRIRYEDQMYGAEDYMFWVECSLKGKIKNLDRMMLLWRRTESQQTTSVMKDRLEKRNQVLMKIRRRALEGNGYRLSEEELSFLNHIFAESVRISSRDELERLYRVLQEICRQAVANQAENKNEVIAMCRKRFGEKVGKAFFLWEEAF